ncbi:DedA family protein [Brachybacterium sp. EF45031]|uniref:DedA family protein n=1 Tax=Brachybacterium sillae TaxID=2810536 RepID=UPI00217DD88E|nr:DedA family protein [Brachybacterium sillae]MCS6711516.1 DedA family protein [Brachybacterium sillae]
MDITELSMDIIRTLGGPGIALLLAAEALFPPIPGEVLLPFVGVTAAAEGRGVLAPILWTTTGSVLGGLGVYGIGRGLGLRRARGLADGVPLLDPADVDTAVRFFDRHGTAAVITARFVPVVRTFISVPAGIERMPVALFALATGIGSGIWNGVFVTVGYLFGTAGGDALQRFVQIYSTVLAVIAAVAIAGFVRRRLRDRRQQVGRSTLEP